MAAKETVGRTSIMALSAMRIGIGALTWLSPTATAKLFGIRSSAVRSESSYPWRLFGIRDVVLGTATLRARNDERRAWVALGLVCDAADGTAAMIGRRDGSLPPSTRALVVVPAAAVALGIWLLGNGLR